MKKKPQIKKMRNKELIFYSQNYEFERLGKIFKNCLILTIALNIVLVPNNPATLSDPRSLGALAASLAVVIIGLAVIFLKLITTRRRVYIDKIFPDIYEAYHSRLKAAHEYTAKATKCQNTKLPTGLWGAIAKIDRDMYVDKLLFQAKIEEMEANKFLNDLQLIKRILGN